MPETKRKRSTSFLDMNVAKRLKAKTHFLEIVDGLASSHAKSWLLRLPVELVFRLASFLTPISVCRLAQTCRLLSMLFHDDYFWGRLSHQIGTVFSAERETHVLGDRRSCCGESLREQVLRVSRPFGSALQSFSPRSVEQVRRTLPRQFEKHQTDRLLHRQLICRSLPCGPDACRFSIAAWNISPLNR